MAEHRDVNLHNSRLELVFEKRIPGLRVSEAGRHHRFIMRSRHVHETIELHFILEGQRLMFVDRETYRLSPHSAIVVNHNLIHKTSTAPGFPPDHHNFILQLDRSRFDQILRVAGLRGFDDFGDRFNGVATFNDSEWRLILAVIAEFKAMCTEDKNGGTVSMEDAHAFLYLQALELASIFAKARRRLLHAELEANQKVVPETYTEENYLRVLDSFKRIRDAAEKLGVMVGVESVYNHTLRSPEMMRRFLDDIDSVNFDVILDAVNLITPELAHDPTGQNALIRQAFTLYGDRITTLHLKDCVFEGEDQKYRHPGEGIFCYEELMRQVAQWKPYIIGTLENSSPDRYAADCAYLQAMYEKYAI